MTAELVGACGEPFAVDGATGASTGSNGGSETGSAATTATTAGASTDEHAVDGDFLSPPDAGSADTPCSPWDQDCTLGHKCTYYDGQGDGVWNATKCVPIAPDPDPVGAACTVVHSPLSGLDSCDRGAMCWGIDVQTGLGRCEAQCRGTQADPVCPDPRTHCVGHFFGLCLADCDPLLQDCREGDGCYPLAEGLECAPDASGPIGRFGDPCDSSNACNVGMLCAAAVGVPGCEGPSGCCTSWCELDSFTCALIDPQLECVPWYEPGHAPPGRELVGSCLLPSRSPADPARLQLDAHGPVGAALPAAAVECTDRVLHVADHHR